MKKIFQLLIVLFLLTGIQSCKGKKQAQDLQSKVNGIMDSYKHPTSKNGLYVEAKIDGARWVADWMFIDPDPSGSINVKAHKGEAAVISFWIGKHEIKEKGSEAFTENNQAQMFDDKGNILLGKEGSY